MRIPVRRKTGRLEWVKPGEGKRKREIAALMRIQSHLQGWRPEQGPLPGRPMVLAARFSPVESDPESGWAKSAIDQLTTKGGLNMIEDDRLSKCDPWCWWEPSGCRRGVVLLEVWTGGDS